MRILKNVTFVQGEKMVLGQTIRAGEDVGVRKGGIGRDIFKG